MAIMRDWYNNTVYSTGPIKGNGTIASGAFETPDRFSGSVGESQIVGSWYIVIFYIYVIML